MDEKVLRMCAHQPGGRSAQIAPAQASNTDSSRHTRSVTATRWFLLTLGMNLRLLSSALGHADVSVTADRYLHVADREVIEGYQRFRPTIVEFEG